ncbi:hypothetical protein Ahia01_000823500 [Argonauta hians]
MWTTSRPDAFSPRTESMAQLRKYRKPSRQNSDSNSLHQMDYLTKSLGTIAQRRRLSLPTKLPVPKRLSLRCHHFPPQTIFKFNPPSPDEEKTTQADPKPKPKLLEQLEEFLQKELLLLGLNSNSVNGTSLQAHREAFEYLIENFKSYRHILSCIKNSYEMALKSLKSQLRNLLLLKQMVVTNSERYEQKIMKIYENKRTELEKLKDQNNVLRKKLSFKRGSEEVSQLMLTRLKKDVVQMNQQLSYESAHHSMLVTEFNHLYQTQINQEQVAKHHNEGHRRISETDVEPVDLMQAIRKVQQEEKLASEELSKIAVDYEDVIPRTDYDLINKKYQTEKTLFDDLTNTYNMFQTEHKILVNVNEALVCERDHYQVELKKLTEVSTATKHWKKCVRYISGKNVKWEDVSDEDACQSLMQLLVQTLNSKEVSQLELDVSSFTGMGRSESVPNLLRHEGMVQNRRMTPRDCLYMINDIWLKRNYEDDSPFEQFIEEYMVQQYPDPQLRTECVYTFYHALKRLAPISYFFKVFWKIFNREYEESVYYTEQDFVHRLLGYCKKHRANKDAILKKDEFKKILQDYLKGSKPEFVTQLIEKASQEMGDDVIVLETLLNENDDGMTGPFLTALKQWYRKTCEDYVEMLGTLRNNKYTVPDELRSWFRIPKATSMKPISMSKLLSWCFQVPIKDLSSVSYVATDVLLARMAEMGFKFASSGIASANLLQDDQEQDHEEQKQQQQPEKQQQQQQEQQQPEEQQQQQEQQQEVQQEQQEQQQEQQQEEQQEQQQPDQQEQQQEQQEQQQPQQEQQQEEQQQQLQDQQQQSEQELQQQQQQEEEQQQQEQKLQQQQQE